MADKVTVDVAFDVSGVADASFAKPVSPRDGRKNVPARGGTLIADVRNDITIPGFTTTLTPLDDTLIARGGGLGLKLYDEIERDPHAYAVLQKRKLELVAREWEVVPGGERAIDRRAATFVEEVLRGLPFDRICLDLLDATLRGFAISEVVWARTDHAIIPSRIVNHDQRRFTFGTDWRPRLLTRESMMDGIALPERKFMVHRFGVKGNNPFGLGLGTRLFWWVLFKREGIAFWLTFLEKYCNPTPVAKTPVGMLPEEQRKILVMLEQLVASGAITVPIGTELDYLEATRSAPANHEGFGRYCDEQMSECVCGETLSTNIGSVGSMAAASVHSEAKSQIVDADGDLLSDTLRATLLRWLVELNLPGAAVPHLWRIRPKNEEAEAKARAAAAVADKARVEAIDAVVSGASHIEDDGRAREWITSFPCTDGLDDGVIDALLEVARSMRERAEETAGQIAAGEPGPSDGSEEEANGDASSPIAA